MSCYEDLAESRAQVQELMKALDALTTEAASIGTIVAGPQREDDRFVYRVNLGGRQVLTGVTQAQADKCGFRIEDVVVGAEVAFVGAGAIVRVVGDKLKEANHAPQMNLVTWDDIGGLGEQVDKIRTAVESPILNRTITEAYGLPSTKGVLLWGPPGCGKTLLAKAVAGFMLDGTMKDDDSFVYVKGPELLNMYVGATEGLIKGLFARSRKHYAEHGTRNVVFIDEADAILPRRGSRRSSDVDLTTVPMFLSEMDGLEDGNPFMILATNIPQAIDEAVLREGRIDLHIHVPRPDKKAVMEIFKIHLRKTKVNSRATLDTLAYEGARRIFKDVSLAQRVSGSMAETVVKLAIQSAIKRDITMKTGASGLLLADIGHGVDALSSNQKEVARA